MASRADKAAITVRNALARTWSPSIWVPSRRYAPPVAVEHPIDRAHERLTHQPLLAADLALLALGATRGHRSDAETSHYLDLLATAVMAASSCPDTGHEDPVTAMLAGTCDSLATAALLRLLVLDEDVFMDEERLRPAMGLFDRFLEARLYRSAGVAIRDQAFEKRAKLRNAVSEHEAAMQAHVDSLGSLDALAPFRQQLSKFFKDQITQVTVRPFTPGVTIQTLNEVLTAVQALVEAGDDQILERADSASARCRELSVQAAEIGTAYARELVGGLAGTLQDLVGDVEPQDDPNAGVAAREASQTRRPSPSPIARRPIHSATPAFGSSCGSTSPTRVPAKRATSPCRSRAIRAWRSRTPHARWVSSPRGSGVSMCAALSFKPQPPRSSSSE
jgi:hypothetical protein